MANKQIPQEVWERFAALYWGQKIIDHPLCVSPVPVFGKFMNSAAKLELKDLADITDEDFIQAIGGIPEGWELFKIYTAKKDGYAGIKIRKKYDEKELQFNEDGYKYDMVSLKTSLSETVDFLRSRGYLLPFAGYSAQDWIDSGRVKIKK